jgi:hypothetical protein
MPVLIGEIDVDVPAILRDANADCALRTVKLRARAST